MSRHDEQRSFVNTSRLLPQTPSVPHGRGQGLSLGAEGARRRVLHTKAIEVETAEKLHEVQRGVRPLHAFNMGDVLPELRPLVIEALANPSVRIISLAGGGEVVAGAGGGRGSSSAVAAAAAASSAARGRARNEEAGGEAERAAAHGTAAAKAATRDNTTSAGEELRAAMRRRAALEFELRRRERENR